MEIRKKFLIAFCLLFGGVVLTEPAVFGASKNNSKRAKSKAKKKKSTKKKKTSSAVTVDDLRASSSAVRAVATTTTTTSSSTAVDEATEIANLTANLLSCLSAQCSGSVDYEKCFKTSNIDVYLAGNATCQEYLTAASSEAVRVQSRNAVVSRIKGYLDEACTAAGGKVNGPNCQLEIYYYAKSADGKHSTQRKKTVTMGNTFNCSYQSFGMSAQDLEYKEDMTSEQKIALAQAGIEGVTGLVNAGTQMYSYFKQSKDLKKKNHFVDDGWYVFDGKSLTIAGDNYRVATYDYGASGVGKDKELTCASSDRVIDSNGVSACREVKQYTWPDYNGTYKGENGTQQPIEDCSSTFIEQNFVSGWKCKIKIEKKTELELAEKQSELARSTGYLDYMKGKAEDAQETLNFNNFVLQTTKANYASGVAQELYGENSSSKLCSGKTKVYTSCNQYWNGSSYVTATPCETEASAPLKAKTETASNHQFRCATISSGQRNVPDQIACMELSEGNEDCTYVNNQWTKGGQSKVIGQMKDKLNTTSGQFGQISSDLKAFKDFSNSEVMKGAKSDIKSYNSVMSSYNSNQNSLNEKKKELQDLKEASSTSLNNAIATGSQAVFSAGTNIATQLMTAKNNKGTMTGACFIGDPSRGNVFLQEGQSKKLEWKLF